MFKKVSVLLMVLCVAVLFSSCLSERRMREYYSQRVNYVSATGTVSHYKYGEDNETLYLAFDDISPTFSDNNFKIVGRNLLIVQENGIDQKIKMGDTVEFITAPKYFGDGYVMPIVSISVDGETLLEFDDGYNNLMESLKGKLFV